MYFLQTETWMAYLLLALTIVPIAILMIYAIVVALRRRNLLGKEHQEKIESSDDESQIKLFFDVYGGKENIKSVTREMSRISVIVVDVDKVQTENLKDLGANGILLVDNIVKCTFGDRAPYIYDILKKAEEK